MQNENCKIYLATVVWKYLEQEKMACHVATVLFTATFTQMYGPGPLIEDKKVTGFGARKPPIQSGFGVGAPRDL